MDYINIAGLKKPCAQLMMGTDYYKPELLDTVGDILDAYMALGGNAVDSAYIYGGGKSEETIGLWMESRKNRKEVLVLTKGAHHNAQGPRVNKQAIDEELAISLQRLRTDYVDLYALHRDDPNVPVGPIIEALNEHIEAGRIHAIGVSNWTHGRIQEANDYAAAHGLVGFTFSSPNLSLAKPNEPFWAGCVSADSDACAWHKEKQLPLLSWSSQARGFFTGLFTPEVRDNADLVRVFYSDDNWERYRRAESLGKEMGVSTIQIALAYVLNQPFPTCALIGPKNVAELNSCHDATRIRLTEEQLSWLDLSAALKAI
ncbi:aldo/keto reductase [Paenibacillus ginsengarvi]|uniref:Aldo/keto reductase n=1 Tax=Paenibacillus ginsengarvi TaxID=400777 RepID=A0A3B0CM09_9BACL|nr:aldo/keto reductase [Paenibacillus ginsengarvi]RKN86705.1 aldo/keto reductase [Paenibacillus ginsengarvi]